MRPAPVATSGFLDGKVRSKLNKSNQWLDSKPPDSQEQIVSFVKLVAKHLFDKELDLKELPCPRTCLNFMAEAHHIAKQHMVNEIKNAKHFTYICH